METAKTAPSCLHAGYSLGFSGHLCCHRTSSGRVRLHLGQPLWPARLNSTQLPDVYGVVVEKQRGNRPLILPRDDILKEAVSFKH